MYVLPRPAFPGNPKISKPNPNAVRMRARPEPPKIQSQIRWRSTYLIALVVTICYISLICWQVATQADPPANPFPKAKGAVHVAIQSGLVHDVLAGRSKIPYQETHTCLLQIT